MMEGIGTAAMGVALLAAFAFIVGAFALLVWDLLGGRMGGWVRVVAVVVVAPACALAATGISAGIGWVVASTLEPDEPPPAHTEQGAPEGPEGTSSAEGVGEGTSANGGVDSETTAERSGSPTATPPSASASASPTATASPTASPSPRQ